jgi:hypothetical protein
VRTPKFVAPAELKIPRKPSTNVGALVANSGRIKTLAKVKGAVSTQLRLYKGMDEAGNILVAVHRKRSELQAGDPALDAAL